MEIWLLSKEEFQELRQDVTELKDTVELQQTALLHIGYVPATVAMKMTGIMTYNTLRKKIEEGVLEKKPSKKKVEISIMSVIAYMKSKQGKRTDYIRMQVLA